MKSTIERYSPLMRLWHWSMALVIIGLISLGWWMTELDKEDPARGFLYGIHKSFGVLLIFLWFGRFITKILSEKPSTLNGQAFWKVFLAKATHLALYVLMIAIPVSGYLMSNSYGYPDALFGFELPMIAPKNIELAELASEAHEILAYGTACLIALHISGVIFHSFIEKPRHPIWKRMI